MISIKFTWEKLTKGNVCCKYRFMCYILKKKVFTIDMIKTTLLSWQNYVQKVKKKDLELPLKFVRKSRQNLCRNYFNMHDVNTFYPSNITSKPRQMNVQIIESSIKYLKRSIHIQNELLSLTFLNKILE